MKSVSADGKRIIAVREARGWTQECLAEKAGYVDRTIRKAESGKPLSLRTLIDISLALRIDLSEIVAQDDYERLVAPNRLATEQLVSRVGERDSAAILSYFSPTPFLSICSNPSSNLSQRDYIGREEIEGFLQEIFQRVEWKGDLETNLWVTNHEYVVVHGHGEVFVSPGKASLVNWCITLRFHSGLISEVYLYHSKVVL